MPISAGGGATEPELERLGHILRTFSERLGSIEWGDSDPIRKMTTEGIPAKVAADPAYQNAMAQRDRQSVRIEHDSALRRVIFGLLRDDTELLKQFSDNISFRDWLADTVFSVTYAP